MQLYACYKQNQLAVCITRMLFEPICSYLIYNKLRLLFIDLQNLSKIAA